MATPMICTQSQLQAALIRNGATPAVAKILAAIGLCEAPYSAAGISYSNNADISDQKLVDSIWWYSYGFFSIRSKRAEAGKGTWRDQTRLTDPDFNCKAAIAIQKESGYTAWSTYVNGAYKAFLQDMFPVPAGVYRVVSGDSLSRIAQNLNKGQTKTFTWQALAYVNGLVDPWIITIGQNLLLPWISYTVQSGDSLTKIVAAQTSGVTLAQVAAFNNMAVNSTIVVGQKLLLPRAAYLEYLGI